MRWLRLVFRIFGWLLTPFLAWAASFFGAVGGALIAMRIENPVDGLAAAIVYLLIDVTLLQNIGTYGHRWLELGGGSNWWYHPIWWMAGTCLSWLGAWTLANQLAKGSAVSPGAAFTLALGCGIVLAVVGTVVHFPGAAWNLGTFGVAFLPGLALATAITSLGMQRA